MFLKPKPVVLFFPFDLMSHYSRCLQLAESIADEYEIYFAHSDKYLSLIEEAGFKSFDCEAFDSEAVIDSAKKFDFDWLNISDIKRVFESQVKAIERFNPLFVLADTAPTLRMAGEATGTYHISLMNGYMTKYYKYVRKLPKVHPAAKFEEKVPSKFFEFMIRTGERFVFKQVHKPFRKIRQENGLSHVSSYLDELEGDSNLICDLPEFFPQKDLPEKYKFIGPTYFSSSKDEPEVLEFLAKRKKSILISMGSTGDLSKLSFLNKDPFKEFNIVIAGAPEKTFHGEHIFVSPFLNNTAFLDRIDLVLTHGGNGSIYQALAYGVPVLCSTSIFEQDWNVHRLVDLKLGAWLDEPQNLTETLYQINYWISQKSTKVFERFRNKINVSETQANFKKNIMHIVT